MFTDSQTNLTERDEGKKNAAVKSALKGTSVRL